MTSRATIAVMLLTGAALGAPAAAAAPPAAGWPPAMKYELPLAFEANHGQTDAGVRFLSRGTGYTVFLAPTEAVLSLYRRSDPGRQPGATGIETAVLRMKLLGANARARVEGTAELSGKSNYFIGSDPAGWRRGVPNFAAVRYEEIYPGVDLVFHGSGQRQLEYDFVVAPGADPRIIRLRFEGASRIELADGGDLVLGTPGGALVQRAPVAYQEIDGVRRPVDARFERKGDREVAFRVAAYDRRWPLVIDPVLSYSTYLGGSASDQALGIAVDDTGSAYVTGGTCSLNFPIHGALQPSPAGGTGCDAFIAKFSPAGTSLVYSTYLGGANPLAGDSGLGIAVDGQGSAYVTGRTCSTGFPTVNPVQGSLGGGTGCDAFVAKLSPAGDALVYSTYLGGVCGDSGIGIAVDGSGNAFVAGETGARYPTGQNCAAAGFPVANPFQGVHGGLVDAFVTKLSPGGNALVYSTYLGGSGDDVGWSVALDGPGNAYVTGSTLSFNFPTVNALQPERGFGEDAFVAKLSPAGTTLDYSTFLGGGAPDFGHHVAVDASGNAYVAGQTRSPNFPVVNALQPVYAGFTDAFVAKLSASGTALVYSTFLGGNSLDVAYGIAVDGAGSAHVAGQTFSTTFPIVNPVQAVKASGYDAFVTKLSPSGTAVTYSTYLGGSNPASGSHDDGALGIALDAAGNAYVVGFTHASSFPTADALQPSAGGQGDGFVVRLAPDVPECADGTDNGDPEDTLADAADAGCHADGDPDNPGSYDPTDADETDVCGDSILHPAEQCDDGNTQNGDGCSSTCQFENHPPDCAGAAVVPSVVWSPDHRLVPLAITGLTDPDGDAVTVVVDAITQDEPTDGVADGDTCPDGAGVGTTSPVVRAERSGLGDGRVYHIAFTARDPGGAACAAVATVCVPRDQHAEATCVDQGPLHDSTRCE